MVSHYKEFQNFFPSNDRKRKLLLCKWRLCLTHITHQRPPKHLKFLEISSLGDYKKCLKWWFSSFKTTFWKTVQVRVKTSWFSDLGQCSTCQLIFLTCVIKVCWLVYRFFLSKIKQEVRSLIKKTIAFLKSLYPKHKLTWTFLKLSQYLLSYKFNLNPKG